MTRNTFLAATAAGLLAATAFAKDTRIMVHDAFARASGPNARAGAAFMTIVNESDKDDRLIGAASDAAQRVELHTHVQDANGVMRMVEVEDGISIPAGGTAHLKRGGDHVMFMGLTKPFVDGETVVITLTFEAAGEMVVDIPVDLDRQPGSSGDDGHAMSN